MNESFKRRVVKFWKSFLEEESQIREMMDNNVKGETLLDFVDSILKIAFHSVYFEMGKNEEGKYELVLTPEGDRVKLLETYYWLQYAPAGLADIWSFHACKPGDAGPDYTLSMFDVLLKVEDVEIYPEIDSDKHKINIKIYSSKLNSLNRSERYSLLFIYLDQFIGELYTMNYIGYIDIVEEKQNKYMLYADYLKIYINNAIDANNWTYVSNPYEYFSAYTMTPSEEKDWKLRDDIMSGYTSCMPLLNAYYSGDGHITEQLSEDGFVLGFLFFENSGIARDSLVNFRTEIEDKLQNEIAGKGIANSIGGATGFHFSYIDFAIADVDLFLPIAKEMLSAYAFDEAGFSVFKSETEPEFFIVS